MWLTGVQGVEKKDILVLRKSSVRKAYHLSNWLLWWGVRCFRKWAAAKLGAGVRGNSLPEGTRPLQRCCQVCVRAPCASCAGRAAGQRRRETACVASGSPAKSLAVKAGVRAALTSAENIVEWLQIGT